MRCRQGSTGAWQRLFNKYERLVYSIPLRYGLSRHDAADITQTTFTILIQSLDTLRDDSRLGPWLATVARHRARDVARNRRTLRFPMNWTTPSIQPRLIKMKNRARRT